MKTCYIKCVSNEQAQQLRPELVKVGFVDREKFNDGRRRKVENYIVLYVDKMAVIRSFDCCNPHLYTLSPDEDITEAAEKIKTLFDNQ